MIPGRSRHCDRGSSSGSQELARREPSTSSGTLNPVEETQMQADVPSLSRCARGLAAASLSGRVLGLAAA